jgi:acyl-coenzyme A synthetase/AMP-(fatty) acid ligase
VVDILRPVRDLQDARHAIELAEQEVLRDAAAAVVALRHGARELTYAELDARSNRLAQALLAAGVGRGARVAYLGKTAPEVVELLLAASKIGAVDRAVELALVRARARRDPR